MSQPIVDAHHHLWPGAHVGGDDYLLEQLHADTASAARPDSEIAATVSEKAIEHLEAPVGRVAGFDTPFPYSLEHVYKPDKQRVLNAIEYVARWA